MLSGTAAAQTLITEFETTVIPGGAPSNDEIGFTFTNDVEQLDTFVAGGTRYAVSGTADQAFVRRNSTNANRSSIWYSRASGTTLDATHGDTVDGILLGNTFRGGSDNTFVNGNGNDQGNIERLDFVFSGGITATATLGFAVMDRGGNTNHDPFKIALITDWDANVNNVATGGYSDVASQSPNWGTANPDGNFNYQIFRYTTGDDSSTNAGNQTGSGQGIGGVVFGIDDFNVSAGTTIYGYSLFGYDVNATGDQLIDWTNSTYFSTNTSSANGGIDLAAINGVTFSVVPEPATFALYGLAVMALGVFGRRRRRTA